MARSSSSPSKTRAPSPPALRTQVLIVGGGMAGLTLAAGLGGAGIDTIIVDKESAAARTAAGFDGRTTAIAHGSRQVMEGTGVWPHIAAHGEPILDIRIADGTAPVFLHYDHREVGDDPFGAIFENARLRQGQFDRLDTLEPVTHLAPALVVALDRSAAGVAATLDTGQTIRADLVVGADGRGSFVRRDAGIATMQWRYNQTAIVCVIAHDEPHHGLAVEHFMTGGPFAVLPMRDTDDGVHRSSIVWSERRDLAAAYLRLGDAAFDAELQRRVGDHRGAVRALGQRFSYPLGVLHADRYVGPRMALIGEAAHAIHPIAGQGLNMGLRDVAALAELTADAARLGLDVGDPALLTRYERWRRRDNIALLAVTDGLNRLFSNAIPPVRLARDFGLAAVGRLPPVKRFFMRHAMGVVGPVPRLIRGETL
ncbi:MAG: UbiH/UbiF/VisC/COQ6 family ubiquinone biosynthesis hydroxylase [Inquilinaceae bacterium]